MAPPPNTGSVDSNNKGETANKKKGDDVYISAARTIARCIDLWCDIDKVIKTVQLLQQEEASKHGELDEDDTMRSVREECLRKISPETREYATLVYHRVIRIAPGLKIVVDDPSKMAELSKICFTISTNIKGTRASDANHLKPYVPRYCAPNPHDPTSLNPPVLATNGRSEMGMNHPILARWLCPADQLNTFDMNPEQARKDLASGVIPMEAEDFPALFWSGALPGGDFDPNDMSYGLFRSYFLIRVARHIFLGPSFAVESTGKKKRPCNAILNDVTTIEAEHIAYICVQGRFAISSKDQWSEIDGKFNYYDMYKCIIRLIKHSVNEWKDDLLKWWNKEIFGNENGRLGTTATKPEGSSTSRMSTMERLQAQMKERVTAPPRLDPALRTSTSSTHYPSLPSTTSATSALEPVAVVTPVSAASTARQLLLPTVSTSTTIFAAGPSTVTAIPNAAPSNLSTTEPGPTTPCHSDHVAVRLGSPLSEVDEELALPLTPVTNRKGTQSAKARGKRPARAEGEEGDTANGGRYTRKSKRCRK